ncbi:hypothetical protein PV327_010486 [Microctonus hyperodae]|uniref:Uncharacterized protein n=1 Tax=Microctonus hyperodae TaxID=165561 RepID=A0AA39FS00_MICHY|nr:hypothetical protein PV327_010486 [Microctonus hyperodae]
MRRGFIDVARAGEREANEMSGKLPTTSSSSSSLSLSLLLSLSHTRCRDIAKIKCPLLSSDKYCSCCYYTIRILKVLIQADYYSICYHPECFQDGVQLMEEKERGDTKENSDDDNDDDDDDEEEEEDDEDETDVVFDHWRHQSIMW